MNWRGTVTLYRKEVQRFLSVIMQTVFAPVITSLLYLVIFAYVLDGGYKTQPSFQRWLSARADHLREQGKDVDIWRLGDEQAGTHK